MPLAEIIWVGLFLHQKRNSTYLPTENYSFFFVREGENIAGTLINIWPKKVCLRYFLGGKKQKIL